MKKFFITGIIIGGSYLYYIHSLDTITRLDKEIYVEKKIVQELEKDLLEKKIEFEKKLDLKAIESEMQEKYNMGITQKINYFSTKEKEMEE